MAAILVPADMPRLLAALDELSHFPDEDVRQSVVIMLAGLAGLLSQKNCTDLLLPRIMRLLQDSAYLVRKVGCSCTTLALSPVSPCSKSCLLPVRPGNCAQCQIQRRHAKKIQDLWLLCLHLSVLSTGC